MQKAKQNLTNMLACYLLPLYKTLKAFTKSRGRTRGGRRETNDGERAKLARNGSRLLGEHLPKARPRRPDPRHPVRLQVLVQGLPRPSLLANSRLQITRLHAVEQISQAIRVAVPSPLFLVLFLHQIRSPPQLWLRPRASVSSGVSGSRGGLGSCIQ